MTTPACAHCTAPLRPGAKFCGACGAQVFPRAFCMECGSALGSEAYCPECGTPVATPSAAASMLSAAPYPPTGRPGNPLTAVPAPPVYQFYQRPRASKYASYILLMITSLFSIFMALYDLYLAGLYADEAASYRRVTSATLLDAVAGRDGLLFFWGVVFLGSMIVFLVWLNRVYHNLPFLVVRDVKYTPGWAVGWWFVPVMCFWRPYQVMKEVWLASDPDVSVVDRATRFGRPVSLLLGWWWAAWLAWYLVSVIGSSMAENAAAADWEAREAAAVVTMVSWLLLALAGFSVVSLVKSISDRQDARSLALHRPRHRARSDAEPTTIQQAGG